VVEVSPESACEDFVESVESAAGFFFFFFAVVESLCDWSVDCADEGEAFPCVVLVRPNPSNNTVKTAVNTGIKSAKRKFFSWVSPECSLRASASFEYRDSRANNAAGCAS
jgi:hypothetical protein